MRSVRANSAECFYSERFQLSSSEKEARIEKFILEYGRKTMTRKQIAVAMGIDYSEVAARVHGLMKAKRVYETGEVYFNEGSRQPASKLIHVQNMPGMQGMLFTNTNNETRASA